MLHKNSLAGNIHTLVNWKVADATALAALTLNSLDIYKIAYQVNTQEIKMLIDNIVPTWQTIANAVSFQPLNNKLSDLAELNYTGNAGYVVAVTITEDGWQLVPQSAGVTDHTLLSNIGTLTHPQIETELVALDADITALAGSTTTALAGKQPLDTQLTDIAGLSYTGNSLKALRVNVGETAFELATISGGGGGLTYITEALVVSAPNATVNVVSLTVTGGSTDADFVLSAKGTGALLADTPDNTIAGGNKRGNNAVDWQAAIRGDANQVASGNNSTIGGGINNRASGISSTVAGGSGNASTGNTSFTAGSSNTAGGSSSVAIGGSNNASAIGAVAIGQSNIANSNYGVAIGQSNLASFNGIALGRGNIGGNYAVALGYLASTRSVDARFAYSAGAQLSGVAGDSQVGLYNLVQQTTNATPTPITTDNAASVASNNSINLVNNSLYLFEGYVTARENATGDSSVWKVEGVAKRGASAATIAFIGSPTAVLVQQDAGAATWAVSFAVNTTHGAVAINVTGEASHTIHWGSMIHTVETVGAG